MSTIERKPRPVKRVMTLEDFAKKLAHSVSTTNDETGSRTLKRTAMTPSDSEDEREPSPTSARRPAKRAKTEGTKSPLDEGTVVYQEELENNINPKGHNVENPSDAGASADEAKAAVIAQSGSSDETTDAPASRKARRCRICRGEGHDARNCKEQPTLKSAPLSKRKKLRNVELEDFDNGFITGSDASDDDK